MGRGTDRCALRPRTYATLYESRRNTMHAQWGGFYARCVAGGACSTCPLLTAAPRPLDVVDERVMVRIRERPPCDLVPGGPPAELHLMHAPGRGWSSTSDLWTWEELRRLTGWELGRQFEDEHSAAFWLVKNA
jgi:hypothetical protein